MMASHIYAVGDIHGYLKPLKKLIQLLPIQPKDTLVFLGDYIDRGPDSKKVIDFLIALSSEYSCIFLKGNHEQLMLNALSNETDMTIWLMNGGQSTVDSYNGISKILKIHGHFYQNLKLYHLTKQYLFVHAGLRPGIPLKKQLEMDLLWIREEFILNKTALDQLVIYGHTPIDFFSTAAQDKIGIDTGCAFGGSLSALQLPEKKLFSVDL